MSSLVQAEMSVLVDILYHPEVLFHSSLMDAHGFSSGGFMTKYAQLLLCSEHFIYWCSSVVECRSLTGELSLACS